MRIDGSWNEVQLNSSVATITGPYSTSKNKWPIKIDLGYGILNTWIASKYLQQIHNDYDQDIKNIVSIYVKIVLLKSKTATINRNIVPIIDKIVAFYHPKEYFEIIGQDIEISYDKLTITSSDLSWNNTTYGKNWIDSTSNTITKWTFKINKLVTGHIDEGIEIFIGITSSKSIYNDRDFTDFPRHCYMYAFSNFDQYAVCNGYTGGRYEYHDTNTYFTKFKTGDVLMFALDLKKKILFTKVNDDSAEIQYDQVKVGQNISYKLAVTMNDFENSISLLDFEQNM